MGFGVVDMDSVSVTSPPSFPVGKNDRSGGKRVVDVEFGDRFLSSVALKMDSTVEIGDD